MPVTVLDSRDKSWLPSPPRNHRLVRKIQDNRFAPWFKANIGVNAEKHSRTPQPWPGKSRKAFWWRQHLTLLDPESASPGGVSVWEGRLGYEQEGLSSHSSSTGFTIYGSGAPFRHLSSPHKA